MNKRLSADEKRKRLLEIFHEKKEFFQLKELEKLGYKEKGIVAQTVKEVLDSLVNDDLVKQEKIGVSNYYWSFPSQQGITKKIQYDKIKKENKNLSEELVKKKKEVEEESLDRKEGEDRRVLIEEWKKMKEKIDEQKKEIDLFKECDPDAYEEKRKSVLSKVEEVNLVTDNIYALQSYATSKFNIERRDFNQNFGIEDDMDYI